MKITIVTPYVPSARGRAGGRALLALTSGLIELGHEISVRSWCHFAPDEPMPDWFERREIVPTSALRSHVRALPHPRSEVLLAGWEPVTHGLAIATDAPSFAAVRSAPAAVVIVHNLTRLDARAVRSFRLGTVQDIRAERRATRADVVIGSSPRVANHLGRRAQFCPVGYPDTDAVAAVETPTAAVLANWHWPPNAWALARLLRAWPSTHDAVPGSRLILGGDGLDGIGSIAGLEVVGRVADPVEVLGRAAVVPFPCPPSSGPKIKVLEALASGVPVVTTPAGIEGLRLPDGAGADVGSVDDFGARLARLLGDPERRRRLGASGRAAIVDHHSPKASASELLRLCGRDVDLEALG